MSATANRVLCFGFFQDGDVGVGIFPERKEVLVGGERTDAGDVGISQVEEIIGRALEKRQLRYQHTSELVSCLSGTSNLERWPDNTHAPTAQFLYNTVVRNDLIDHWRESCVCETGKSMKAVEWAAPKKTAGPISRGRNNQP
jgi:hypothetical protein